MENKGNPYHDSEGKFTSGSNQASPELKSKLSNMGFGPGTDDYPEFDADIEEDGSLTTSFGVIPVGGEVEPKHIYNFLKERFNNVMSKEEMNKYAEAGRIPTKYLAEYGYENQDEFEKDFEDFYKDATYVMTKEDYEAMRADDAMEDR